MSPRPLHVVALSMAALAVAAAGVSAAPALASAHTTTTVVHDVVGAPQIGVIGDSSLAGVRWYGDFGDLSKYSFVFDAESCRRTVETSCWSREGYRPENALQAMQRLSGQWGDVLVVMIGYNDPGYGFDEAVDALVGEAQRQQIGRVLWLTLRTADVSYEEPLHQANARAYRDDNTVLLSRAAKLNGYLQVADWATYSADRDDWFEADGIHLKGKTGARGLMAFVAEQVERVREGESVTPTEAPWYPLSAGDAGGAVTEVQQALVAARIDLPGGTDGAFGQATVDAVRTFQQQRGLAVSGVVDQATAVALGVRKTATTPSTTSPTPAAVSAPQATAPPSTNVVSSTSGDNEDLSGLGWLLLGGFGAFLAWCVRARVRYRRNERQPAIDQ